MIRIAMLDGKYCNFGKESKKNIPDLEAMKSVALKLPCNRMEDSDGFRYVLIRVACADIEFLAALEEIGCASGVALGFDRLVMLATGAARIDDVLWTPMAEVNG